MKAGMSVQEGKAIAERRRLRVREGVKRMRRMAQMLRWWARVRLYACRNWRSSGWRKRRGSGKRIFASSRRTSANALTMVSPRISSACGLQHLTFYLREERLAMEKKREEEREVVLRRQTEALARITKLEQAELDVIQSIEKSLRLVGAFCANETALRDLEAVPVCAATLSLTTLEKPIPAMSESVLFVADTHQAIHVYTLRERSYLFRAEFLSAGCISSMVSFISSQGMVRLVMRLY